MRREVGLRRPILLGLVLMLIPFSGPVAPSQAHSGMSALQVAYRLRVEPTHRYLVDQRGRPFMIVGDSPQSLIVNLSPEEAKLFIANPLLGQCRLREIHGRACRGQHRRPDQAVQQARRPLNAERAILQAAGRDRSACQPVRDRCVSRPRSRPAAGSVSGSPMGPRRPFPTVSASGSATRSSGTSSG